METIVLYSPKNSQASLNTPAHHQSLHANPQSKRITRKPFERSKHRRSESESSSEHDQSLINMSSFYVKMNESTPQQSSLNKTQTHIGVLERKKPTPQKRRNPTPAPGYTPKKKEENLGKDKENGKSQQLEQQINGLQT